MWRDHLDFKSQIVKKSIKLLGNKFFILEAALLVVGLCHVFLKVVYSEI